MNISKKKGKGTINFEDDIVAVYDETGDIWYKGLEDYDPNKDMNWKYDKTFQRYTATTREGKTIYKFLID